MSDASGHGRAELPEWWQWKRLGEIADCRLGKMLDREKNVGESRPYLRNINVQWGAFDLDDIKEMRITEAEIERYEVRSGDLLVCEGGEPGRCAVWRDDRTMFFQKALHRVRPDETVSADYLQQYLRFAALSGRLEPLFTGTTIRHLPGVKLAQVAVAVPPLEEQAQIVERVKALLSVCDEGDTALGTASTTLRRYRNSLLHRAFDGAVTTPLAEVAEIRSGLTKGRKTRKPTMDVPFLRAANVREGSLDLTEIKTIPATDSERERFKLEPGDVLMVEGSGSPGRLGQGWVWEGQVELCLHQNHVFCARLDTERCLPRYLSWFIQSPKARDYFRTVAKTTSGLTTMNKREMSALPIPLPALGEQQSLVGQLDTMASELTNIEAAIGAGAVRSRALHSAVLNAALAGRLVERSFTGEAPARQASAVT